jgi:hypothetical protein
MRQKVRDRELLALSVIPSQTFTISMFAKAYRRANHMSLHIDTAERILRRLRTDGLIEIINDEGIYIFREVRTHGTQQQ